MEPERWHRIEVICNSASSLKPGERKAFVKKACAGDKALRNEIDRLLALQQKAEDFLEIPALEMAANEFVRGDEEPATETWEEVERLYHAARGMPAAGRESFLENSCAGDASLRREVESLLACRPLAENVVDEPALDGAAPANSADQVQAPGDLTGQTLLHYSITEKIGEGGMGVVYRARDTRLGRFVAIKVLPPDRVSDPERSRRFVLEAMSASALSHPGIVTVHDISESGGITFLTMECIEGKTLAELIRGRRLPLDDTLDYAVQIAGALAKAHAAGIVHRDLKPSNIMVTGDSLVKVLDFGLAKLTEPTGADLTALQQPTENTQEGMIVGTAAYMSPEQAAGKATDTRSDIFSFGAMLYEMVTGRRAFQGDRRISTLSDIVHSEPEPAGKVAEEVPEGLERIVHRCLEKNPAQRFQDMSDLKAALEEVRKESGSGRASSKAAGSGKPRLRRLLPAALALVGAAAVLLILQLARPRFVESPSDSQSPSFSRVTLKPGVERFPSLSHDGKYVAYEASGDIYRVRIGDNKPENLTEDSPADDRQPAFSPDGRSIAFRSEREGGGIYLMSATGASVRRLTEFGFNPAWSPGGEEIVIGSENIVIPNARSAKAPAWIVNVASGDKRRLGDRDAVQPAWSPHDRRIAYWTARNIWTMRKDGTDPIAVTEDPAVDWHPVWSPDGRFLYFVSNRSGSYNIWRIPIDEESGRVLGPPEPVTKGGSGARLDPTLSGNGKQLVYSDMLHTSCIYKVPFDPVIEKITGSPVAITQGSRMDDQLALSPDGTALAFVSMEPYEDIWVIRTDGSKQYPLTNDSYMDRLPRWSPNGEQLVFYSNRSGLIEAWTIRADGTGLRQVTGTRARAEWPFWYPDGLRILYSDSISLWSIDPKKAQGDQAPVRLTDSRLLVSSWSSDGRDRLAATFWPGPGIVVYSIPNGTVERYTEFGMYPVWLNDNRRLLFRGGGMEEGDGNLYILDTHSGETRLVYTVPLGHFATCIQLSPDNRTIYYPLLTNEADLWMLSLR